MFNETNLSQTMDRVNREGILKPKFTGYIVSGSYVQLYRNGNPVPKGLEDEMARFYDEIKFLEDGEYTGKVIESKIIKSKGKEYFLIKILIKGSENIFSSMYPFPLYRHDRFLQNLERLMNDLGIVVYSELVDKIIEFGIVNEPNKTISKIAYLCDYTEYVPDEPVEGGDEINE